MSDTLSVSMRLENDKVRFRGSTRSMPPLTADYFPPIGDGEGYTGLELLLMSLAACSATTVLILLRQMKKNVTGFKVLASGVRREQHPTSFETISLEMELTSPDTVDEDMEKVLALSRETYCPVWAMLKGNVRITPEWKIKHP